MTNGETLNVRQPLKRFAALVSAAVVGLAAAAAVAAPAEASGTMAPNGSGKNFKVSADVWGEAECKSGEWHVTWHLEDTTVADEWYFHRVDEVKTHTKGGGAWQVPTFEAGATLVAGTDVPKPGQGELTGVQILPGDTGWVMIKVSTKYWKLGSTRWGTTPGVDYKLYLDDCQPEPPVVTLSADCSDFTVVLEVPANGVLTEFAVASNSGYNATFNVGPEDEPFIITVPIAYDGGDDPLITVAWDGGEQRLLLEDYKGECVGSSTAAVSADCIEFAVVLAVPDNGLTTTFTVTSNAGDAESHSLAPGDAELTLYYLIGYDGETQPWLQVEWGDESVLLEFEDYDGECIAYSDLSGEIWSQCDGVGYEFLNTGTQNGGVTIEILLVPSVGDSVSLTLEPGDFVEGLIAAEGTVFNVDLHIQDAYEGSFYWEYDAEFCDEVPPPAGEEPTTPVAQEKMPVTGSSLTIAVVSALALALAGAALFIMMRRRRMAENW
jgi:hypothetical protein